MDGIVNQAKPQVKVKKTTKISQRITTFTIDNCYIDMQILTLEITDVNALKVLQDLQDRHFINIIAKPNLNSLVFPGKPLTKEEFQDWIKSRENGPSMSLKAAKAKWSKKKSQLTKLAK